MYLIIKMSFKNKIQLLLEVIMLARQLEIYQRTDPKIKIKRTDCMLFCLIKDLLLNWKERMFIVKPDTVVKWHRTAFKFYWRWKSRPKGGRPKINWEVINLIKKMAKENLDWGAPRIHGELLKLGFNICESTVQRYTPKKGKRTNGQSWTTFLNNHAKEIISIDFLTVPAINLKLLHVLVILKHHRRKLIYLNVTKNPTAEWCLQQIRNMLMDSFIIVEKKDKKTGAVVERRPKTIYLFYEKQVEAQA